MRSRTSIALEAGCVAERCLRTLCDAVLVVGAVGCQLLIRDLAGAQLAVGLAVNLSKGL